MVKHFKVVFLAFALLVFASGETEAKSTKGFAKVSNAKLYYEVAGKGEPLILIHGGNMDRRMWDAQFDFFARRYKVIRYDVRGFGKSDKQVKPFAHHQDLHDLMKFLRVERAYIVGLSLGGAIATDFALIHPEMVKALILACPGIAGFQFSPEAQSYTVATIEAARDDGFAQATEMWLRSPYMIPAMERPELRDKIRRMALDNAEIWLRNFVWERDLKPLAWERLQEIQTPTLIIASDRDTPDILTLVERAAARIKNSEKIIVKQAGHMVNLEKPEEFNRAVLDFLEIN
jgi:pimeloyl-ACP methyl ester carboxylesterase